MKIPSFYHKKPIFGLDIGSESIKMMQLERKPKKSFVKAFGMISSSSKLIKEGVIVEPAKAAEMVDQLLSSNLHGQLTTNRVAMCVPAGHVFTRVLNLPSLSKNEMRDAVRLEVEQSIPMSTKDIYYHFEATPTADGSQQLIRLEAVPKKIIDSYVEMCDQLGLFLVLIQTNIRADAQLCREYEQVDSSKPYIIIDIGSETIDVGLLDSTLRVTGTVEYGGNSLTKAIASKLKLDQAKAQFIKVNRGLGPHPQQKEVLEAVKPILDEVENEVRRLVRFYSERINKDASISQVLVVGGGANMPGLAEYLTNAMHATVRISSPWISNISFGKLIPPNKTDLPRFLSCAGLALSTESEVTRI